MIEGLFDRYFRLLAGQLPARDYGVIADLADGAAPVAGAMTGMPECLC